MVFYFLPQGEHRAQHYHQLQHGGHERIAEVYAVVQLRVSYAARRHVDGHHQRGEVLRILAHVLHHLHGHSGLGIYGRGLEGLEQQRAGHVVRHVGIERDGRLASRQQVGLEVFRNHEESVYLALLQHLTRLSIGIGRLLKVHHLHAA